MAFNALLWHAVLATASWSDTVSTREGTQDPAYCVDGTGLCVHEASFSLLQTSLEATLVKPRAKVIEPDPQKRKLTELADPNVAVSLIVNATLQFSGTPSPLEVNHVSQLADPNMAFSLLVIALLVTATYKLSVSDVDRQVVKNGFLAKGGQEIVCWCIFALLMFALGTVGLVRGYLEMPYAKGTEEVSTSSGVLGYTSWLVLIPVAVVLFLSASLGILTDPRISELFKSSWLGMLVICWALAVGAGAGLARASLGCGVIFCFGTQTSEPATGTIHTGLWVFFVGSIFFIGFLVMFACPKSLQGSASGSVETLWHVLKKVTRRREACQLWASVSLSLVLLPSLFLLTTLLPSDIHFEPSALAAWMATEVDTAELKHAWMITMNVKLSDTVILKIFPDTLMFYLFLEILAVAAMTSVIFPSFGRHLKKKSDPTGLSIGEKYVMVLFSILLILWVYYWLIDHSFHAGKETIDLWWWERIARTWGQTAVLLMSLLLLPASKNSLWLGALGISWEQSLWVHRWLGYASLVCMAAHILSFWARFAELGAFPYDAIAYILYYPVNNPTLTNGDKPTYDNWTIPNQQLIAYPALLMIGIPVLVRRKHWELFKYFHFVFLALIPAVLVHAASAWYFMLGGVAFWLVDACIRFAKVVTPPACLLQDGIIVHEAEDGITELRMNWTHAQPGQFAWIKVPSISAWEWHPFSLSSGIDDGFAQMAIKNMGPDTFTDKLYQLGKQARLSSTTFDIQVDGPYGPFFDVADHGALLLIAGGIGITQVHSTFRTISQLSARGESFPHLRSVRLVWIGRTSKLFQVFAESLKECVRHSKDGLQLSVVFFHTQATQDDANNLPAQIFPSDAGLPSSIKVLPGKPSFTDLYAYGMSAVESKTLLIQACGPEAMVEAAAEAARGFQQIVFESVLFVL